jgi:AcrR family transcriptional regulator
LDKQTEIIEAAQRLFGRFGLKKVTVEDIAAEAKVSKVTIYRYYRNKNEIFNEVIRAEADQMYEAIKTAMDKESTAEGKLRAHLVTKIGKIRELVNFYLVTHEIVNSYWPYIGEVSDSFTAKERKLVAEALEFGNQSGQMDVEDVNLMAHILVVSLKSLELNWAVEMMEVTLETFTEMLLAVIFNGLKKS